MNTQISAVRIARGIAIGVLLLSMVMAATAQAAEREKYIVGVNAVSWHSSSELDYPYEVWTPGIYVRENSPLFWEAGVVRNSQGFWAPHVGLGYQWDLGGGWDLNVTGGVIYGYRDWLKWDNGDGTSFITYDSPKALAFLLPSVGYQVTQNVKVRTVLVPRVGPVDAWAVSTGFEWAF